MERVMTGSVLLAVAAMLICTMCSCSAVNDVTTNRLDWRNPLGAELSVEGHKDTIIEGLEITRPDGTVIKMAKYQSVSNAAAIEQAGAFDKAMTANMAMAMAMLSKLLPGGGPVTP